MTNILLLNYSATLYMIGVIWMVQLVHYPLMGMIGNREFESYHEKHVKLMSLVVGPAMLTELLTMTWIFAYSVGSQYWLALAGLSLLCLIWFSTAILQVPCHRKLEGGFDLKTHQFLVRSNWIRTVAWSARGGIMQFMLIMNQSGGTPEKTL